MDNKENNSTNKIDLIKWFVNTVIIGLLTFFFTWLLDERKQGLEEIKVYTTYVELVTNADNLPERRLLAQFFSHVTVSKKLKEGWQDYYEVLDKEFKDYLAKENSVIQNTDSTTLEGKIKIEKARKTIEEFKSTGFDTPIIQAKPIKNEKIASEKEFEGFSLLLEKNLDDAIIAFGQSEDAYPSYHQVYEIEKYLIEKSRSTHVRDNKFWNSIYAELVKNYNWKMPVLIKTEMANKAKETL